jgi:hypothetical protein
VSETTINQRLKFLIGKLAVSARAFSEMIGESPTNTQNYVGSRQTEPKHEYLAKVVHHFDTVNAHWLLTGEGAPFLNDLQAGTTQTGNFNQAGTSNKQTVKSNKGNVQTGGGNTMNNLTLDDCKNDLEKAQREIEYLRGQLKMQETVLAAKEETITLLRASFNRPN